ncbi:hypothetical protein E2986_13035 [Frieseomelitta varia]|uniref:ADP/ATP translocase n=1 Tax=Frieseomelitta varia TaxID=561572 RepID=A0A833W4V9_9HYME|nr:hypothetical protein E2986_13035 [Frieseomelitta varia]
MINNVILEDLRKDRQTCVFIKTVSMEDQNAKYIWQSDSAIDVKLLGLDTRLHVAVDFGASFIISGILAVIFRTVTAPVERVKLILQTQASSHQIGHGKRSAYSGILNALVRIPKEQGSIYFGAYIVGKRGYMNNYATDPPTGSAPFLISLTIAQLASYLALIVSYPLDTISRQKMLWSGREAGNYVSARQVVCKEF